MSFAMTHVRVAHWNCATQWSFKRQHFATLRVKHKLEGWSVWQGCTLHRGENVDSLWHVESEEANEKLKKQKWWVAFILFRATIGGIKNHLEITPRRLRVFIVGKLTRQVCDQGCNSIFYIGERHKFLAMTLGLLCKANVGSHIEFILQDVKCRWTTWGGIGDWRLRIVLGMFSLFPNKNFHKICRHISLTWTC